MDLCVYPLDTLKTRLQINPAELASKFPQNRGLYSGLYQGVGAVVVATLPAAGLFFTTYEHSKSLLSSNDSISNALPPAAIHMASSSIAELASCLVLTPAELIKQRSQVVNRSQASSTSIANSKNSKPSYLVAKEISKSIHRVSEGKQGVVEGVEKGVRSALKEASKVAPKGSALLTARNLAQDASNQLSKAQSSATSNTSAAESALKPLASTLGRSYLALAGRNLPFTALQFPLYEHIRGVLSEKVGLHAGSRSLDSGVDLGESDVELDEVSKARAKIQRRLEDIRRGLPSEEQSDLLPNVENRFVLAGLVSGASAAVSGSIAAGITTPIDVAKTRIMLRPADGTTSTSTQGVFHTLRQIAAQEGAKGLMKGSLYRCLFTALGAGVYLGTYEAGRLWWRSREKES